MRWSPLLLVLSCAAPTPSSPGAAPSPSVAATPDPTPTPALAWTTLAPATSPSGDVFADDAGVWRCTAGTCRHLAWSGATPRERPLPCADATDLEPSQAGTRVVQLCGNRLEITTLATGAAVQRELPFPEIDQLIVDDDGVVTVTHEQSVARITAKGVLGPFALELPADALTPDRLADLYPARGPWLAYTHGAYEQELAWRASTPSPTAVALGGGALWNGDQMWVSLMTNGYVRMDAGGPVRVAGRIGGGLPGHGVLLDTAPWGPDGMIAQYEDAALLVDREFVTRRQIQLPGAPNDYGRVGSDPSGTRLYYMHSDGRIDAAML